MSPLLASLFVCAVLCAPVAGQLRPDEITAPQTAVDDSQIKDLLHSALDLQAKTNPSVADLDKEIGYFQQILDVKSDHAVAWDGLNKARAQKQALLEKQTDETQKKSAGGAAATRSQQAFIAGDMAAADKELDAAQRLSPNDPLVVRMATRIAAEKIRVQRQRLVALLTGGVLMLALIAGAWRYFRMPSVPWLELRDGTGRRFRLDAPVSRVGAIAGEGDRKNDIVLTDPDGMVSRYHCEIRNERGKLYAVDLNSRNGTTVDGRRVPADRLVPIGNGSRIDVAMTYELRIVFEKKK